MRDRRAADDPVVWSSLGMGRGSRSAGCFPPVTCGRGAAPPRPHGSPGEPTLPGRHDVRRLGQPRSRRFDPDHPSRARRGDQLRRHGRRLLERRVGGDRRQGARRPAGRDRARDQVPRSDGRRPEPEGELAPVDRAGGRQQPAPPRHRLDRPLPGPPPRPRLRHRRDARRADRPRAGRQDPLPRELDLPGPRDRRGTVDGRAAQPRALHVRAAALLAARPRDRGGRAAGLQPVRHGRHPVGAARGRLAERRLPARARSRRRARGRTGSPGATTCRGPRTSASSRSRMRSPSSPRMQG